MADCINEITGVQTISLYPSDSVALVRPDISNENEVNLISDGEDSYIIFDPVLLPKWERVVGYSGNYKQNYLDEFTFLAFGIENEIPAIIKEIRNTRVGYVAEIKTIGDSNYVFQSPVFLNNANTKQIDSHSWQISLSYRIPSFLDKLTNLATILGIESEILPCDKEIQGVQSISLYVNENIDYNYPDLSNENEVDVIVSEDAFLVVDQVKEQPKWERIINYSENYKQNYNDEFAFLLHGIENDVPETIKTLRNNRLGYIAVITTTSNKDYIFPTPIFLNENNTKQVDSHSWAVSLSYRVPSFENKLTLLDISLFVEGIDIPLDMSTPSTAGFNLTFASGNLFMDWDDGGGLVPFVSGVELLKTYTTPGTKNIKISGDLENITKFIADNSKITQITDLKTGLLTRFDIQDNLYDGDLDMSNAPISELFFTKNNTSVNTIFATSGNGATAFNLDNSGIVGVFNALNVPVKVQFRADGNPLMTNAIFSNSGNLNTPSFSVIGSGFTTLDLSNFQNGLGSVSIQIRNTVSLINISFSNTGNSLKSAGLYINSLDYTDFTGFTFSGNSYVLNYNVNSASTASVNQMLVELYGLVSGESGGGDYVSRTIHMGGSGVGAPDGSSGGYDGLTAKTNLQGKGITVNTN